jgi:hypothetical protein
MERPQIKMKPIGKPISNLPIVLPPIQLIISYGYNLEIEGEFIFKYQMFMLVKNFQGEIEYKHQLNVTLAFHKPPTKDEFYSVGNQCYQTAVIEFNKTLDVFKTPTHEYKDMSFDSLDKVKLRIDNALTQGLN